MVKLKAANETGGLSGGRTRGRDEAFFFAALPRTAKLAMAEGLIEQSDFDVIKKAFLKAQHIKADMDAGE